MKERMKETRNGMRRNLGRTDLGTYGSNYERNMELNRRNFWKKKLEGIGQKLYEVTGEESME